MRAYLLLIQARSTIFCPTKKCSPKDLSTTGTRDGHSSTYHLLLLLLAISVLPQVSSPFVFQALIWYWTGILNANNSEERLRSFHVQSMSRPPTIYLRSTSQMRNVYQGKHLVPSLRFQKQFRSCLPSYSIVSTGQQK